MPHLILEYTNNVREERNFSSLFTKLHQILHTTAHASLASCKSRAVEHSTFQVGDGGANKAFVHLEIRLAEGRSDEVRQEVGRQALLALQKHFYNSLEELDLQITVHCAEISRNFYFKIPEGTV